jgi:hypothetical protein
LDIPLTFDFITQNVSKTMENSLENVFNTKNNIYYLNNNQLGTIIFSLELLDKKIINQMKWILYHDKKLNNKNDIILSERDALGLVFRINDLDNEINSMVNWNVEEISTPDFLRNLKSINLIEDQLIMNDLRCFGNWRLVREYAGSICTFLNGKRCVTIIYANRTKIERNIGVDLIYFDHFHHTYIFVQYKRLSERNGRDIYYPASDNSLEKELTLMENFEANLSKDQFDYRINDQVFYFKFCKGKQEVFSKELSSGFYIPKDYFLLSSRLQKEKSGHINISYDTITRYLNNTVFIGLIKSGLIGTKINDTNLINNLIRESLANNKSLILAEVSPI